MVKNQEIRDRGKELYIKNYLLVAMSLGFIVFMVLLIGGGITTLLTFSILKELDIRGIGLLFFIKGLLLVLVIGLSLTIFNIFKMGIIHILAKEKKEEETEFNDLFFLFKDGDLFFKTVKVSLGLFFIYIGVLFLIFSASGSIFTYMAILIIKGSSIIYMVLLSIVILIIFLIGFPLVFTMFSQSFFILYGNRDMAASKVIALSAEVMVKNKLKYIGFSLGYTGWKLLGIATLVGVFFSSSYQYAGKIEFYNELVDDYLEEDDNAAEKI